jgi:hypothetical protein
MSDLAWLRAWDDPATRCALLGPRGRMRLENRDALGAPNDAQNLTSGRPALSGFVPLAVGHRSRLHWSHHAESTFR